ncbi:MAG: M28 family peptidase, partial [Dehalococcoidia bacterium]
MEKKSFGNSSTVEEIKEMVQDLCDLAGYGVHSGINVGEKGETAANYILEKLHDAGLKDARLEPVKVNSPFPECYEVLVEENGKEISLSESCSPLHWTVGTPPEGIIGELAYVGTGADSNFQLIDVTGKIVLIDEKFFRGYIASARDATMTAKDKRAIAVFRANMQVDSPQQQKGEGTATNMVPIPVFCFSKSAGDYLRKLAVSGTPHTVKIKLEVKHQTVNAHNVVFELPGNGNSEEVILAGTHYDTGYFTGAVDNNGSVALLIKWAEYFASKTAESRNHDMIFAWCLG